ncbi:MAG TPA: hypothetical protein VIF09_25020 [Polyangiaceae bacterium]|jgi:hypothetical protein
MSKDRPSQRPTRKMGRTLPPEMPGAAPVPDLGTAAARDLVDRSDGASPTGQSETRGLSPSGSHRSSTLPAPHMIPRLLVEIDDLVWVAIDDETRSLAELVDSVRTVRELAAASGLVLRDAQLRLADLRDRHVVALD